MTKLSQYFTLEEMTFSQTASRLGLDNTPTGEALENLKYTAECMDKVREFLGHPIHINSGYRSPEVNKAVGSTAKRSQHMDGQAVDFTCAQFGTPEDIVKALKEAGFQYDQIIYEYASWVHISFVKANPRKEALVIDNSGTRFFA
jgi:NADH dehydrogenase/NADH:ubiquinone oxidoreductase subunit G